MMKRRRLLATTGGLATMAAARGAGAQESPWGQGAAGNAARQHRTGTMQITRSGSQPSQKGPADYFKGWVRIDSRFQGTAPARVDGGTVTFPGPGLLGIHTLSDRR